MTKYGIGTVISPVEIRRSTVFSSGLSPVTVKYLRWTVSLYSDDIFCLKSLKLSIESLSFFLSPLTTDVLVRSDDDPGPQPGRLRLAALDRSKASNLTLRIFAFFKARWTSASMRVLRSLTALALWRVLLCSWELRRLLLSFCSPSSSLWTASTSWKNLPRSSPFDGVISMTWWSGEELESKSFISSGRLWKWSETQKLVVALSLSVCVFKILFWFVLGMLCTENGLWQSFLTWWSSLGRVWSTSSNFEGFKVIQVPGTKYVPLAAKGKNPCFFHPSSIYLEQFRTIVVRTS